MSVPINTMRVGRTLTPAAAPIALGDVANGVAGMLIGERELDRFRAQLCEHFGVRHCFLLSSGKAALALTLLALRDLAPARNEVIVPAFTCYSVPSSVIRAGLRVSPCDIAPDVFDFDFDELARIVQDDAVRSADVRVQRVDGLGGEARSLAVLSTHLFGFPADVERARKLCSERGIAVIEDAAQAMGESQDGKLVGTVGDVAFFSLGRGKAVTTVEGGIILTRRDDIAEALQRRMAVLPGNPLGATIRLLLKAIVLLIFVRPWLYWLPRGMPFLRIGETLFESDFPVWKMSPFQAGLARNWQRNLRRAREVRRRNAERWASIFLDRGWAATCYQKSNTFSLLRFPMRIRDARQRRAVLDAGSQRGLGVAGAYPMSVDALPELAGHLMRRPCPNAARRASELVTLPTHENVQPGDFANVCDLLGAVLADEAGIVK